MQYGRLMQSVSVVGEFNDWDTEANPMQKQGDSVYEVFVPGARRGSSISFILKERMGGAL